MSDNLDSKPHPNQKRARGHGKSSTGATGVAPVFILVEPQMGENIGAAARAMLNFGIQGLRLVAPRDGWPNPAAKAMAAGASSVIDGARVFETLSEAVADCHYVLATTARPRESRIRVVAPQEACELLAQRLNSQEDQAQRCAVLFGGERAGLTADHLRHVDGIITIPVNPAFASLNLAQAVLLIAYEWGQAAELEIFDSPLTAELPANRDDFDRMIRHLEEELDSAGFFHPPEKRALMVRNLTASFMRAGLTHIEVQTMRGVIKALAQGRGANGRNKS